MNLLPNKSMLQVLCIFLLLISGGICLGAGHKIEVGSSMSRLIEADWVDQDSYLNETQPVDTFDFPLRFTNNHIERGYTLAARLDMTRVGKFVSKLQRL
jgi:hypothetical protein